jgi:hypothetical protein
MQYPVFVLKYTVKRVFYTSCMHLVSCLSTGTVVATSGGPESGPGLCYRDVCRDAMEPIYPELEEFEDVL